MEKIEAIILWNTGDDFWDNDPIEEVFTGTLEELGKYLDTTESEDAELFELFTENHPGWTVSDNDGVIWEVYKN